MPLMRSPLLRPQSGPDDLPDVSGTIRGLGLRDAPNRSAAAAAAEKASRKAASKKAAFVPDPEAPAEGELPEVADVPDVVLEGEEAAAEGEEETFLPEEEEDTDVSGFIDGGIEEGGEEET